MKKTMVFLAAVVVVAIGAWYSWLTLFSASAGGTPVVDSPVVLATGSGGSGSDGGAAPATASGGITEGVARSTFKSFVLAMAREDPDTACGFAAYKGAAVDSGDVWDACRVTVIRTVESLSGSELAALRDALRTGTYTVTGTGGDGSVSVSTTVLGQTVAGTVVDAGGEARVELTSLTRT